MNKNIKYIALFVLFSYKIVNSQPAPIEMPGFPIFINSGDFASGLGANPIIADFNNDGFNEIFLAINTFSQYGHVYLLNSAGEVLNGFPKIVNCFSSYTSIAAGDVNGDGFIDLVVKADSLFVFDYHGDILNGFPAYFPNPANNLLDILAIYDLNNDKKLEILLARRENIYVYDYTGSIVNGWPRKTYDWHRVTPSAFSIGDLDNDNIPEIILPASKFNPQLGFHDTSKVFIYKPDGSEYITPIRTDSNYYFRFNPAIIYKLNNATNFIINSNRSATLAPDDYKGRVENFNGNGSLINSFNLIPYYEIHSLSLWRATNDINVVFGNSFFQTYLYNSNGVLANNFPLSANANEHRTSSIGKLTEYFCLTARTNAIDFFNGYLRGYLHVFQSNGEEVNWSPLRPVGGISSAPTFCDLNKDGQADMLIVCQYDLNTTVINAFTFPGVVYSNENFPWKMIYHDRYRSNQYGFIPPDEPVSIQPNSEIIKDFKLYQNYPNPFNARTEIKFTLNKKSNIILLIYDISGRLIYELKKFDLIAGEYELTLNLENVTSGVYFYSLQTNNLTETKKMMLLK